MLTDREAFVAMAALWAAQGNVDRLNRELANTENPDKPGIQVRGFVGEQVTQGELIGAFAKLADKYGRYGWMPRGEKPCSPGVEVFMWSENLDGTTTFVLTGSPVEANGFEWPKHFGPYVFEGQAPCPYNCQGAAIYRKSDRRYRKPDTEKSMITRMHEQYNLHRLMADLIQVFHASGNVECFGTQKIGRRLLFRNQIHDTFIDLNLGVVASYSYSSGLLHLLEGSEEDLLCAMRELGVSTGDYRLAAQAQT